MINLRILGFDIENKPLAYLGDGFTTAKITAIAACWANDPKSMTYWPIPLGKDSEAIKVLEAFRVLYDQADVVTGHYIRKHDLPHINGALMRYGRPPLEQKMTIDTKNDWFKKKDISAKLENLLKYYGIPHNKAHVSAAEWEAANDGDMRGLKKLRQRCEGDVRAQLALYKKMAKLGHLSEPKVWRP